MNKDYVGSYTAIIDALEKENKKLTEENKELKDMVKFYDEYIVKYHNLVGDYRKLIEQYKNKIAVMTEIMKMEGISVEIREVL